MPFKKWSGIENAYNSRFIDKYVDRFPELLKEKFSVTEKIDGANFSIVFFPEGRVQFAKRSGWVTDGFYNYKAAFAEGTPGRKFVEAMTEYCLKSGRTLQFVGELFGTGVQKRIYYGEKVYWRWYAIYEHINDEFKNFTIDEIALECRNINVALVVSLFVPFIGHFTFDEAINLNPELESKISPRGDMAEGVVIRPMSNNYEWGCENFILKIKNKKFEDRPPKKQRQAKVLPDEVRTLIEEATLYVNRNRTLDLYSKHGKFDEMKKFGEYIKLYIEDVLKDFHKEYPLEMDKLSKDERKSLGKAIVGKIREELKETM